MSEEKKNPALEKELEAVEDDALGSVAGGISMAQTILPQMPGRDEPGIPGFPSENDKYDSAK